MLRWNISSRRRARLYGAVRHRGFVPTWISRTRRFGLAPTSNGMDRDQPHAMRFRSRSGAVRWLRRYASLKAFDPIARIDKTARLYYVDPAHDAAGVSSTDHPARSRPCASWLQALTMGRFCVGYRWPRASHRSHERGAVCVSGFLPGGESTTGRTGRE